MIPDNEGSSEQFETNWFNDEHAPAFQFAPLEQQSVDDDIASRRKRHEREIDAALADLLDQTYHDLGVISLNNEIDPDNDEGEEGEDRGGGNGRGGVPRKPRPSVFPGAAAVELPEEDDDRELLLSGAGPRPILH